MKLVENALYRFNPIYESDLVGRFCITQKLIAETHAYLREFGENEGLAYWAGKREGDETIFTTLLKPRVDSHPRGVFITPEDFASVAVEARKMGVGIFAQVHSHPGKCSIHSDGDDELIVAPFETMLSLVVPHYAQGVTSLDGVTIHQRQAGYWRVATKESLNAQFRVCEVKDEQ